MEKKTKTKPKTVRVTPKKKVTHSLQIIKRVNGKYNKTVEINMFRFYVLVLECINQELSLGCLLFDVSKCARKIQTKLQSYLK